MMSPMETEWKWVPNRKRFILLAWRNLRKTKVKKTAVAWDCYWTQAKVVKVIQSIQKFFMFILGSLISDPSWVMTVFPSPTCHLCLTNETSILMHEIMQIRRSIHDSIKNFHNKINVLHLVITSLHLWW